MHNSGRVFVLLTLAMLNASAPGQTNSIYAWKTFTGQPGGSGNSDGTAGQARFAYPYGIAVDSTGDLYIADTFNHTIRKMTSAGVVTTLAGSPGLAGSADGAGSAARFSSPTCVAVDNVGNVYVTDTYNNTIRKVTSSGVVTTLAGSAGQVGSADGIGSAAHFDEPYGVAVNSAGDVYVTDAGNCTVRKVTSAGVVTTLAGTAGQFGNADGTNGAAQFYYPAGVAVDSFGNVFVADLDNSTIRKVTGEGAVTTLAGTPGEVGSEDGTNNAARFFFPSDLAVDSAGNVYLADTYNSTIRRVTSNGVVTTLAGTAEVVGSADGTNVAARFNYPSGISVDGAGNLFVADTDNSILRKVTSAGVVTTLAGSVEQAGTADADGGVARFNAPYGVAVDDSGNVCVADTLNHTIRQVTSSGLVATLAGSPGQSGSLDAPGTAARFFRPYAVAVDNQGDLFVADTQNQVIRKVAGGVVTTLAGASGQSGSTDGTNSVARFSNPVGIATDNFGNLYVTDFQNSTIRRVTSDGVVTTLAGSAGQSGSADGTNGAARFNGPFGVATDGAGNVYVTDSANHTLRKITSDGAVTTLAGTAGQSGSVDGTNSAARFYVPTGVAVDSMGNLYIADTGNAMVRKVTSAGVVTTLAGSAGQLGSTDGTGSAARFLAPAGVGLDSADNLYVADAGNATIRKVTASGVVTTLAGKAGQTGSADVVPAAARFFRPYGVALDNEGNLFVADTYNSSIRKVSADGAVATLAGLPKYVGSADGVADTARFRYPFGLATDSAGNVYVADSYNNTIRKVTSIGEVTTLAGSAGLAGSADGAGAAARFSYPCGVAVDGTGNVFVTDLDNCTLRKVSSGGVVTTFAGSAGEFGGTDGSGPAARFGNPNGVAVDSGGNLYVADSGNSTLRKVTSAGLVTTLAGNAGQRGSADGTGSAARFDYPFGVAVDGAGNIYVADSGNSTIRQVTSDGVVSTIGGYADVIGGVDGIGSSASFAGPGGIAVDGSGRLYVADVGNNRISRGIRLPVLRIVNSGTLVTLLWPSPSAEFALQQTANLSDPNSWSVSSHSMSDDGTNKSVTVTPAGNQFFRLIAD